MTEWSSGKRKAKEAIPIVTPSLPQTQLNAIVTGSDTWYRSQVKWLAKILNDSQTYTSELLKGRGVELGALIAQLKMTLMYSNSSLSPQEWLAAREKLAKYQGQQNAISLVLDSRAKLERFHGSPKTSPSTGRLFKTGRSGSTARKAPEQVDTTSDPFADQ